MPRGFRDEDDDDERKEDEPSVTFSDVSVIRETDKALLCLIEEEEVWIPKTQIVDGSEVFDADENSSGKLMVTEWIALQKGLVH